MKLHELSQTTYNTTIEGESIFLTFTEENLNESLTTRINFGSTPQQSTKGIVQSLGSKAMKFFKNPIVAGATIGWALTKLDDYQRNKKYAVKLYAISGEERSFYKKMVDDLLATGKYKIIKAGARSGGYEWHLQKKWGR